MTGSRYRLPTARAPALISATTSTPHSQSSPHPFLPRGLPQRAPTGADVKALRPLTRSGFARALTPTPQPAAPTNQARGRKTKRHQALDSPHSFRDDQPPTRPNPPPRTHPSLRGASARPKTDQR
jgi:hypothetical protein